MRRQAACLKGCETAAMVLHPSSLVLEARHQADKPQQEELLREAGLVQEPAALQQVWGRERGAGWGGSRASQRSALHCTTMPLYATGRFTLGRQTLPTPRTQQGRVAPAP